MKHNRELESWIWPYLLAEFSEQNKKNLVNLAIVKNRKNTKENQMKTKLVQNGTALRSFKHDGKTFVVCPDNGDFEVEIECPIFQRIEVVVSVDGLSVMDGKPASSTERGYVVSDGKLRIPGWRLNGDDVAKFTFTKSENSYSARTGQEARNIGCVGAIIYSEKIIKPQILNMLRAGPSMFLSCDVSMSKSADIGTGFGSVSEFKTTSTTFERGDEIGRQTIYYRPRKWFEQNGILIPFDSHSHDLGNAFPADNTACVPPKGWSR